MRKKSCLYAGERERAGWTRVECREWTVAKDQVKRREGQKWKKCASNADPQHMIGPSFVRSREEVKLRSAHSLLCFFFLFESICTSASEKRTRATTSPLPLLLSLFCSFFSLQNNYNVHYNENERVKSIFSTDPDFFALRHFFFLPAPFFYSSMCVCVVRVWLARWPLVHI